MSSCRQCSFAEYQDEEARASCKACPAHTNNFQTAALQKKGALSLEEFVPDSVWDCFPEVGYFGWPGLPATKCPAGMRALGAEC